jgi:hypothetical protein
MIQQLTNLKEEKPLQGAINITPYDSLSWEKWFNGKYQENNTKYFNDNFGFRSTLIRLNNQKHYSLFNRARANGVKIGKENYLYEEHYIKTYFGLDKIERSKVDSVSNRLAEISRKLEDKGKHLVVLLAPGKGSYYPEYFPEDYSNIEKGVTNYHLYKEAFGRDQINVLDFHTWFRQMKEDAKYPLFPKCGIHWSKYGEYLAADSLIKYIEKKTNKELPHIMLRDIVVQDENIEGDYDIGDGMNLLFDLDTYPMAYPQYKYSELVDNSSPKVLVVADSYYWGMFNKGMSRDCFGDGQFWYYSKQIYPDSYEAPVKTDEVDAIKLMEDHDVVVIISTDANLYKFPFGFTELLCEY